MTKIAYNACYGGFNLSEAASKMLAARKGVQWDGEVFMTPHGAMLVDTLVSRTDPDLIAVIETLGADADGTFADIQLRELPPGTRYRIDEYDGMESVMTIDEYDWKIA